MKSGVTCTTETQVGNNVNWLQHMIILWDEITPNMAFEALTLNSALSNIEKNKIVACKVLLTLVDFFYT